MATRKTQSKATDPTDAVIDAALRLAQKQPWRSVSLRAIADAAGMTLAQLHERFATKAAILAEFSRRIDARILEGGDAGTEGTGEESPRDRLFDVLMRRFDALKPHKEAVAALARNARGDPLAALCGLPQLVASMGWMLEAAGISTAGLAGALRAKTLAGVYLATLRVWLDDDSEDMARTMAALDKRLARAEAFAGRLDSWCGRAGARAAAP